jgi:hypothetical protein
LDECVEIAKVFERLGSHGENEFDSREDIPVIVPQLDENTTRHTVDYRHDRDLLGAFVRILLVNAQCVYPKRQVCGRTRAYLLVAGNRFQKVQEVLRYQELLLVAKNCETSFCCHSSSGSRESRTAPAVGQGSVDGRYFPKADGV